MGKMRLSKNSKASLLKWRTIFRVLIKLLFYGALPTVRALHGFGSLRGTARFDP